MFCVLRTLKEYCEATKKENALDVDDEEEEKMKKSF